MARIGKEGIVDLHQRFLLLFTGGKKPLLKPIQSAMILVETVHKLHPIYKEFCNVSSTGESTGFRRLSRDAR